MIFKKISALIKKAFQKNEKITKEEELIDDIGLFDDEPELMVIEHQEKEESKEESKEDHEDWKEVYRRKINTFHWFRKNSKKFRIRKKNNRRLQDTIDKFVDKL